jgi:hypothetical protein
VDAEEPPQVTASHLRRADDMCRRRLAHELRGGKRRGNRYPTRRFEVSNRLEADARLAQTELGPPRADAFVEPAELEPEQRALYRAAVRGYMNEFGAAPARVVDLGFRTPLAAHDAELVGSIGIAAELPDGRRELRRLRVGGRPGRAVVDEVDIRFALVRSDAWAPDQLDIVAVDVINDDASRVPVDLPADRTAAEEWIDARVTLLFDLAADGRARAGADCQGCAFVAGCPAHAS